MELIKFLIPFLCLIESNNDPNAIGDNGKAVGILQIHECVVHDVNKYILANSPQSGTYTLEDRLDPKKSKEICSIYLTIWGRYYEETTNIPADIEVLSRIWNGGAKGWSKSSTEKYWDKVESKIMEKREEVKNSNNS